MTPAPAPARSPEFIIDRLFPSREVHLITGPSGSGKTRLMFQTIMDWLEGKPVFGLQSHPQPFFYVSCDRSGPSVERVVDDLKLPKDCFPRLSIITDPSFRTTISQGGIPSWDNIIRVIRERQANTRVIMLDGFGILSGDTKYHGLYSFLAKITCKCQEQDFTIIGSTHTTKVKGDTQIVNVRQRILGSVGWGGFCDGVIYIDQKSEDDPMDTTRRVFVLPRNGAGQTIDYIFNSDGRLILLEDDTAAFLMEMELAKLNINQDIPTEVFVIIGERFKLARRTVELWLKSAVDEKGLLLRVNKGLYRRKPKA